MIYLLLAISCSALISILMRISSDRITGNVSMLAMNYCMCLLIALLYTGVGNLIPRSPGLPAAVGMGAIHGVLYLGSFMLLQVNVKRNGVVLPAIFMKLGLLVPMVLSVFLFGEIPSVRQAMGFMIAVAAIVLINMESGTAAVRFKAGLVLLLLGGGSADAMSKVFEVYGDLTMAPQFLLYTFIVAFALCVGLMIWKGQRPGRMEILFGLLIGIPNYFSAKFLLRALEDVAAVIVYPTYSVATILVVTLTGVLVFKERLSKRQWSAVGIILAALILLNT
jgi:drug/metabolite transporter (DMT)-like permease